MKLISWKIVCCIYLSVLTITPSDSAERPHIIFILADDLGWNDVGFHGMKEIPTPNIDALAADGVILDNYYGAPMCTPSRAALHTGRYPHRLGLQHFVIPETGPWGLPLDVPTLADHLKQLGYVNRLVGKWHLGFYRSEYLPTNRGYLSHYGFWVGAMDFFSHSSESGASRQEYVNVPANVTADSISLYGHDLRDNLVSREDQSGEYLTDLLTQRAVEVISEHNTSEPLYLLLAHHATHRGNRDIPMRAPEKYTKAFGHINDDARRNFAGSLTALDTSIGQVMAELSRRQMLSNSLVIFVSDNGADVKGISANGGSNWPLRGQKITACEGGVRLPAVIWSPFLQHPGTLWSGLAHHSDWLPTLYTAAGGNSQNLGDDLDGVDLWTAISENLTSPRTEVLIISDPLFKLEALRSGDYKLVKGFNPNLDGWSSVSGRDTSVQFLEPRKSLTETVLSEFRGRRSPSVKVTEIVCGGVKPIEVQQEETSLYDLTKDPCEYRNIAKQHPQIVSQLSERLREHREKSAPPLNTKRDYLSNPVYYNGRWSPWKDDMINK